MLPDEQNYVPYSCNGSQTEFPITFSWTDEDTIKVYILNINTLDESELTNPDDFSVAENNVITKKAWSSDYKLFIYRILPIEQPIDFKNAGKISLEVIENILDDYGRVLQQFRDMIARTPLLSPTSSVRNLAMEDPVEAFWLIYMSNKYRAREHFGPSDYVIQAFMKLFLESLNAAEARGHIGAVGNLVELGDIEITGPADLDLLQYIAASGKWKDKSLTEIFGALGDGNPWRHNRYTDAESVSAMGAKGDSNPLHHDRYADADAVTAMGAKADDNPLHHDKPNIDPDPWTGQQSITFPNGLIIKMGLKSVDANNRATVTFTDPFPTNIRIALADSSENSVAAQPAQVYARNKAYISIVNGAGSTQTCPWIAIGY